MDARPPHNLHLPTEQRQDPQTTASCPNLALPLVWCDIGLSFFLYQLCLPSLQFPSTLPPPCNFSLPAYSLSLSSPRVTSSRPQLQPSPTAVTLKSVSHPKRVPKPRNPTPANSPCPPNTEQLLTSRRSVHNQSLHFHGTLKFIQCFHKYCLI